MERKAQTGKVSSDKTVSRFKNLCFFLQDNITSCKHRKDPAQSFPSIPGGNKEIVDFLGRILDHDKLSESLGYS